MNAKLVLVTLLTVLLYSCAENTKDIPEKEQEIRLQTFQLDVKEPMLNKNRTADAEKITKVSVYLFNNNVFYRAQRDITTDASGQIALSVLTDSKLYFISGIADPPFAVDTQRRRNDS